MPPLVTSPVDISTLAPVNPPAILLATPKAAEAI